MRKAKQATAKNVMVLLVAASDHITGLAGLVPVVTLSKNGAAFAGIAPAVTDLGSGWYNVALDAAMTDTLGDLALHITGAAADPADMVLLVEGGATDADVSSRMATFALPANFSAFAITAGGLVDITQAAADKVWATASRLLTAGTNIVLVKGVGVTGFNDLDAAGVRGAVGLAAANLDTQLDAMPTAAEIRIEMDANSVDLNTLVGGVAAVFARTDVATSTRAAPGDAMTLSAGAIDAIWDELVEAGFSGRELMRLFASALLGKVSGMAANAPAFRDLADAKDRIAATTDADGNRLAVTLDAA